MYALKICLWINGLGFLLSLITVFMPMRLLESFYATLLGQPLPGGIPAVRGKEYKPAAM